jgi:hypothetical protein
LSRFAQKVPLNLMESVRQVMNQEWGTYIMLDEPQFLS